VVSDGTGSLHVVWFNQPWLERRLKAGGEVFLYGKVGLYSVRGGLRLQLESPDVEEVPSRGESAVHSGRLVPVYRKVAALGSKRLRGLAHALLFDGPEMLEVLPQQLLAAQGHPGRQEAFRCAHFPGDDVREADLAAARTPAQRRLIFEELLGYQWSLACCRREREGLKGAVIEPTAETGALARAVLPFHLTGAQRRALREIVEDLKSTAPMYRLLHGDVGSGKTIVAFLAMLVAAHRGFQACFMAPTEVLARQQHRNLCALLEGRSLEVGFLSASVTGRERKDVLKSLSSGATGLVVGTHSLIQEEVAYARLGLVVIDEQHRFGVQQRARLVAKGENPNVLVMTATPIPRSLAMTVYGDLDLSVLDERPPGRKRTVTAVRDESARHRVEAFLRKEMDEGRQVFVIFPVVEESEESDLQAAVQSFDRLTAGPYRGYPAVLLHGRQKSREKQASLQALQENRARLLVATSVVEVGVDLPEASAIAVEHAERFGLAQLHQLRGRVGRGGQTGYCILMHGGAGGEESLRRLRILEETDDGFEIAEADLELRGPGEVTGLRQWGGSGFRIANPLRDRELLEKARDWATALLEPGFPWGYGEQERYVRWVEGWQQRWGAYGRIG
jgi:ATP-dependent DNA helicase RecG